MSNSNLFESLESRQLLTTFIVANLNAGGAGSLRDAISMANSTPGADVIEFDASLDGATLGTGLSQFTITDDLTINGHGEGASEPRTLISAFNASRLFEVVTGVTVTMRDLQLRDGIDTTGGAIRNYGTLTLERVSAYNNAVDLFGGAITSEGGSVLTLIDSAVADNRTNDATSGAGGGIFAAGQTTITGGFVSGNSSLRGGGIYTEGGSTLTINGASISQNTATSHSGGLRIGGAASISNATISSNSAGQEGGGLSSPNPAVMLEISGSTIADNTAGAQGGAIYAVGPLDITGSTFLRNRSAQSGGAIKFQSPTSPSTILNTEFTDNTAQDGNGGGIDYVGTPELRIDGSEFSGNRAEGGDGNGGALSSSAVSITIQDSTFTANNADSSGGAIFAGGGSSDVALSISDSVFRDNIAARDGGAIWSRDSLAVTDSTIDSNDALGFTSGTGSGGGIYFSPLTSGTLTILQSTASMNTSSNNGAAVYVAAGGIMNLINSTASGNQRSGNDAPAASIVVLDDAGLNVLNSTIFGNTSGIFAPNALVRSSIIAGNINYEFNADVNPASDYNLIQDAATAGGLTNGSNSNVIGQDPLLGPLMDNGGPTLTHLPMESSPAINAGSNSTGLSTDQRGEARNKAGTPDIGSTEFTTTPVTGPLTISGLISGAALSFTTIDLRLDGSSYAVRADFYADWNDNGQADSNELVLANSNSLSNPFSVTDGAPPGDLRIIAIAYDLDGQASAPVSTVVSIITRGDAFIAEYQSLYPSGLSNNDAPVDSLLTRVPIQSTAYSEADWSAENYWFQDSGGNVWALWHGGGVHAVAGGQHRWVLTNLSEAGGLIGQIDFAPGSMSGVIASWGAFSIQGIADGELVSLWWSPESSRLQWGNNDNGWVLTSFTSSVLRDAGTGQPLSDAPSFRDYTQTQRNGRFTFHPDATPQLGGGMSVAVVATNGDVYVVTFSTVRQPLGQPAPALPNLWLLEPLGSMPGALAGSFDPIAASGQYRIASGL